MVEFKAEVAPASPTIGALESAIAGPCIERGWRLGVDRQSRRIAGQARVSGAPTPPAISALKYAIKVCPRVERGRQLGVDSQSQHRKRGPRVGQADVDG